MDDSRGFIVWSVQGGRHMGQHVILDALREVHPIGAEIDFIGIAPPRVRQGNAHAVGDPRRIQVSRESVVSVEPVF